jgi:hypothetical protein
MTVYSVKVNKHKTVKTTQLHEARNLAKQLLAEKIVAVKEKAERYNRNNPYPYHPYLNSVCEKMYIRGNEIEYCFYANVVESCGARKTYRITIKAENILTHGYNFDLHTEITNKVNQIETVKKEQEKEI